ncbi:hypothetical protein Tco_0381211 [Tanacetum coccineum]
MGDENHIHTLRDYSKPSHEGYRNTIELPVGNNIVPLRFDTIRLVQNGCLFHGLRSEDPNHHLKDFLKLVDSLDLDSENRERTRLPTIKRLAQYEDEGWNDALTQDEVSLNFENPDVEQLLGIMERKVDALMTDAISLIGKSKSIFRLTTNKIYQPSSEPSRQEEFKHIVTNFILDQEERITQLENYMQVIVEEFIEFSSEVARRLKERIKENENKPRKTKKIIKYPDTKTMNKRSKSTRGQASSSHNETFEDKVCKFRYDPLHKGVTFRLRGVEREMFLLEFGWRVGLYSEGESRNVATLSRLRKAETVNSTHKTYSMWPSIGDGMFNVGNTKAQSIRNPRIKLAHWCIIMTITATRGVVKENEGDDEEGDEEGGNKGVGGFADVYRNMSAGVWQVHQAQWMGQQDDQWGRIDTWMEQQDQRAHLMYDHTVIFDENKLGSS